MGHDIAELLKIVEQCDHDSVLFGEAAASNHLNISYILKSLVASCLCMNEF